MSILKSTNSGTNGIFINKELLIKLLKEMGYDTLGPHYVATNKKYKFLPNIYFDEIWEKSEKPLFFYIYPRINIVKENDDQYFSFSNKYIIKTYADFLSFKNDINMYIDKYVNS